MSYRQVNKLIKFVLAVFQPFDHQRKIAKYHYATQVSSICI